jgi:hypothetical protein
LSGQHDRVTNEQLSPPRVICSEEFRIFGFRKLRILTTFSLQCRLPPPQTARRRYWRCTAATSTCPPVSRRPAGRRWCTGDLDHAQFHGVTRLLAMPDDGAVDLLFPDGRDLGLRGVLVERRLVVVTPPRSATRSPDCSRCSKTISASPSCARPALPVA